MKLAGSAMTLLGEYYRSKGADLIDFSHTDAYRQFVEAAEQAGFTGPDVEMDSEFSYRSPEWIALADDEALRRWTHTLIRADRWNGDSPNAVWMACQTGCMGALVERLSSSASALHAGR